jgi:hypothetical protein
MTAIWILFASCEGKGGRGRTNSKARVKGGAQQAAPLQIRRRVKGRARLKPAPTNSKAEAGPYKFKGESKAGAASGAPTTAGGTARTVQKLEAAEMVTVSAAPIRCVIETYGLGFVDFAQFGGCRIGEQCAEKAVRLAVGASRKEQGVVGAGAGTVAESEGPEAVNCESAAVVGLHRADEAAGDRIKCGDLAAAEIADQDFVAELAEFAGGKSDSPG